MTTPATVAVRLLAGPTVVPVNVAVYVPGVPVSVTGPNVPALPPTARERPNAPPGRPLTGLRAAPSTAIVTVSVLPAMPVGAAKPAVEFVPLTGPGVTVTVGCAVSVVPLTTTVRLPAVPAVVPVNVAV